MNFFTRFCLIAFILCVFNVKSQVVIRNTSTQKSKEINFGTTIYYKLFSDSVLGIELTKDIGVLITTSDSSFVLSNGIEIPVRDIKYLEIKNKKTRRWRGIMSPFLIAGIAYFTNGITMAVAEGYESYNKTLIPLYTVVGGGVTIFSSIPFWLKNKSYDLTTGHYEILIP
tara:strand:+ start:1516 stop:2025 length:510 start_codon:yes stop_codon:yes gene_type:complete